MLKAQIASVATAIFGLVFSLWPLCLCGSTPSRIEPHRSPYDLAVLPGGQRVLTANQTADSVSLVDVAAGKVLSERSCGRRPSAVAITRDGKLAAVSNLGSGTVSLFVVHDTELKALGESVVGPLPRGLVFGDGVLYVAVAGADEVVSIDVKTRKIAHRWPAPREPRRLALTADGRYLAAACTRSGQVRLWDTTANKQLWEEDIGDAFNLRGLAFTPKGDSVVCAHVIRRTFPVSKGHIEEGWVIDSRLTRLPIKPDSEVHYWQIALDKRGQAVGDPDGLVFHGDELAISAAGTHELLLTDADHVPWSAGSPGDTIDVRLEIGDHKLRRVELGGRPLSVVPLAAANEVAVANYLLDAVQIVDVKAGKLVRTIPLGGPKEASPARQGEAMFYDARRSHNQWFSCNTCHSEGHTCGLNFDTLNDDSYGNPKLTPSLRGVTKTGPWTWHGWQKDLGAAVTKSFTETMYGPKPTDAEVKAMLAFFETLEQPPNPHRKDESAVRGEKLFRGKAGCVRCHKGEEYTSTGTYDVGLEDDGSPYDKWNPPSLRGLWDRGPYLHDGRAPTLDELLKQHHTPQKLGGEELTADERKDLIAFLKSL